MIFIKQIPMLRSAIVVLLLSLCNTQSFSPGSSVIIIPNGDGTPPLQNPSVCTASCFSCQPAQPYCETCLKPYFVRTLQSTCAISNEYNMASLTSQLSTTFRTTLSGGWTNPIVTTCASGDIISGPYTSANPPLTYNRGLFNHDYFIIKFLLYSIGWDASTSLTISVKGQNNNKNLITQTLSYKPTIPSQTICMLSSVQSQSVWLNIQDYDDPITTSLIVSFTFTSTKATASYAISTFLVLSGKCDVTCASCSFTLSQYSCLTCNNFFILAADSSCSLCGIGFYKSTTNVQPVIAICAKCPIEFQSCALVSSKLLGTCNYGYLGAGLFDQACKFRQSISYTSLSEAIGISFASSLLTIAGQSSLYQCGAITIIGLAQSGKSITRLFQILPSHLQLSISFNIFRVDQLTPTDYAIFILYIDSQIVNVNTITMKGLSNNCGNTSNQVFQTYDPTPFYSHNSTTNLNITIQSNTTNWGIRDFRVVFQICDPSCLKCGKNGCLACPGLTRLGSTLSCSECIPGFGIGPPATTTTKDINCMACKANCLKCNITGTSNVCTKCTQGYFAYEGDCQPKPNAGNPVSNDQSWLPPSDPGNPCTFKYTNFDRTPKSINFWVSSNTLDNSYKLPDNHYKIIVDFDIVKIDDWNSSDYVALYVNDLMVMKQNFSSIVGNTICSNSAQPDGIIHKSIHIVDNNSSVTAHFEVISYKKQYFGISNFKITPVSCEQCITYGFSYQTQYNYDSSFSVFLQFNRVTTIPEEIFNITFLLYIGEQLTNYTVLRNNSIIYVLLANPNTEIINKTVSVVCKYPEKITTNISDPANSEPFFTPSRTLQAIVPGPVKGLDNTNSSLIVSRYNPLSDKTNMDKLAIFLAVLARIVIFAGLISFLIGCQTACTHMMHNLQKIWIHIFVASLALPSLFKYALSGLRDIQNQTIAGASGWTMSIPSTVYFDTPTAYQQYHLDVSFFRNIYNVGISFLIIIGLSIILHLIFRFVFTNDTDNSFLGKFIRHMRITFVYRPFFVFNSVVFYQYLTVILACTLQFIDLLNRTNQGNWTYINAAAAIITFILATIYPVIHFAYLQYRYLDFKSIGLEANYNNRYGQIFCRYASPKLWLLNNDGASINFAQRIYSMFRFGQIWWMCIIVTTMYNYPTAQGFLLILTNLFNLCIVLFSRLNNSNWYRLLKSLQLLFFIGMEIIILVCYTQLNTLTTDAFQVLGRIAIFFLFAISFISFIRFIYTLAKLYQQYDEDKKMDGKMVDMKLRNEADYESQAGDQIPDSDQ